MILTLRSIHSETSQVSSFEFAPSEPISFIAGQHISMMLKHENPDIRGIVRTFTISSSDANTKTFDITTKRGTSTFKQALFHMVIGQNLQARSPGGLFIMKRNQNFKHLMIASGIGITPFMSMIRSCVDNHIREPVTLVYSNKTQQDITFVKELEHASQNLQLTIIHTLTQSVANQEWQGRRGRIDIDLLSSCIQDMGKTICYICGSHVFVGSMVDMLHTLGIPLEHIMFEKFSGYE